MLVLAGCSSGRPGQGHVVVSATGRVGPLHLDESDRAAVVAFAGTPDSERQGRYDGYSGFDALGYGCAGKRATGRDGVPQCRTVFYLDSRRGRLELLYTADRHYVDPHGVGPGTTTHAAERRLRRRPFSGCFSGFRFDTRTGLLVMWLGGGRKLVGDRVAFLVVHSRRHNPGVLDCIDS